MPNDRLSDESEPDASSKEKRILDAPFDCFLCHNSEDKPEVKRIGELLGAFGLRPWLDEWELIPGRPWQEALEFQIQEIKSAAVFVGKNGIGPKCRTKLSGESVYKFGAFESLPHD